MINWHNIRFVLESSCFSNYKFSGLVLIRLKSSRPLERDNWGAVIVIIDVDVDVLGNKVYEGWLNQ